MKSLYRVLIMTVPKIGERRPFYVSSSEKKSSLPVIGQEVIVVDVGGSGLKFSGVVVSRSTKQSTYEVLIQAPFEYPENTKPIDLDEYFAKLRSDPSYPRRTKTV